VIFRDKTRLYIADFAGILRGLAEYPIPISERRRTMLKRWLVGGIWVFLSSAGLFLCVSNVKAEQPAKPGRIVISEVIITGNQRMSTKQIKTHLNTQPGKEYKADVVDEDVRELYKTNQFSNITTFLQEDGSGEAKVYFSVREMPNIVE
jgi:outer membrane protein assembly factor BamA